MPFYIWLDDVAGTLDGRSQWPVGSSSEPACATVGMSLQMAEHTLISEFRDEYAEVVQPLLEFVGEAGLHRLLTKHGGVFRGIAALVNLASKEGCSELDADNAQACPPPRSFAAD